MLLICLFTVVFCLSIIYLGEALEYERAKLATVTLDDIFDEMQRTEYRQNKLLKAGGFSYVLFAIFCLSRAVKTMMFFANCYRQSVMMHKTKGV